MDAVSTAYGWSTREQFGLERGKGGCEHPPYEPLIAPGLGIIAVRRGGERKHDNKL